MAIKDIKFMNGEGYLLKDLPISLCEYEEQMGRIDYDCLYDTYRGCRDEAGVENTRFPPIVFAFYSIIFSAGKIPAPSELLAEYYELNAGELIVDADIVTYQNHAFRKRDLDARILRTYPSIVRDYHFYLMLVHERCFDRVIYSCKEDIAGKDLVINHRKKQYIVSLFVKTNRSNFFKRIKNTVRHLYRGNEIRIPLDLGSAERCGDFYVYGASDVEYVKSVVCGRTFFRHGKGRACQR